MIDDGDGGYLAALCLVVRESAWRDEQPARRRLLRHGGLTNTLEHKPRPEPARFTAVGRAIRLHRTGMSSPTDYSDADHGYTPE